MGINQVIPRCCTKDREGVPWSDSCLMEHPQGMSSFIFMFLVEKLRHKQRNELPEGIPDFLGGWGGWN
jgi:hypothetical protein